MAKTQKQYGYVVVATSYSYDDAHYCDNGDGACVPVKIFEDQKAAKAEMERLTTEHLRGMSLDTFFEEGINAITDMPVDEFAEEFDKIIGRTTPPKGKKFRYDEKKKEYVDYETDLTTDDHEYFEVPETLTDAQGKKLAKLLKNMNLYYVMKVEKA